MGNQLKAVRMSRRMALWGLAAKAGVSATMLSAIERYDYAPRESSREKIARALGIAVNDVWPDVPAGDADAET